MPNFSQNHEEIEEKLRKKHQKAKPKMKVSGKSVFTLKKIITQKGKSN
ncbi:MAG: hypothetical protein WCW26_05345 [Candidatus Buchananbacteria bacterium]